jgi:6-phospho-beta-glucosidase
VKVVLIGGGGFRTPLTWEALADAGVADEIWLHDTSAERLERISMVIEGLRREREGPSVVVSTDLETAIDGAGAVFCAIRVGGLEGRVIDETIPLRHGVLGQETVGPGGISFALRTVPVIVAIARVVARRAPSAWFLNFTNPAGLVTEAVREVLGDRAVGICDSPTGLCERVARALDRAVADLRFNYAGLNHLGWLLGVDSGAEDLLPALLNDEARLRNIEEARMFGTQRVRALGCIPNEYLAYYESASEIVASFRRAGATRGQVLMSQERGFYEEALTSPTEALAQWRKTRDARFGSYMHEVWDGSARSRPSSSEPVGSRGYAGIATAFLEAAAGGESTMLVLNVANRGNLAGLDDDAVVEVPCVVDENGPHPQAVGPLPESRAKLVQTVKHVERTATRAAMEGSRALALEAIAQHPVIRSRSLARAILDDYMAALPALSQALR